MGGENGRQALFLVGWRSRLESVIEGRLAAGESGEIMGAANNSGPEIARPQLPIFYRPYVLKAFRQDRPEWDVTSDIGTRADDNRPRCPRKISWATSRLDSVETIGRKCSKCRKSQSLTRPVGQ